MVRVPEAGTIIQDGNHSGCVKAGDTPGVCQLEVTVEEPNLLFSTLVDGIDVKLS